MLAGWSNRCESDFHIHQGRDRLGSTGSALEVTEEEVFQREE